jgi:hypothetical protein
MPDEAAHALSPAVSEAEIMLTRKKLASGLERSDRKESGAAARAELPEPQDSGLKLLREEECT